MLYTIALKHSSCMTLFCNTLCNNARNKIAILKQHEILQHTAMKYTTASAYDSCMMRFCNIVCKTGRKNIATLQGSVHYSNNLQCNRKYCTHVHQYIWCNFGVDRGGQTVQFNNCMAATQLSFESLGNGCTQSIMCKVAFCVQVNSKLFYAYLSSKKDLLINITG